MDTVHTAQEDIAEVQSALAMVQGGLETVEAVAEVAESARSGMRRVMKLAMVLLVVGTVAAAVLWLRSRQDASPQ